MVGEKMIECDFSGIYYIKNKINNKIYVGSSKHVEKRFTEHLWCLRNSKHSNRHLQSAWDMYGEDNFEFGILEEIFGDKDFQIQEEQKWIDLLDAADSEKGYNICSIASGGGYIVSDETREKLRKTHLGKKHSAETRLKLSASKQSKRNPFFGKHHDDSAKSKISESRKGNNVNPELWEKNRNHGTQFYTEDTYKKLSLAHQGEKCSNAKLSEAEVVLILQHIKDGVPQKDISRKFNVRESQITRIKQGKRWGYLRSIHPELYC